MTIYTIQQAADYISRTPDPRTGQPRKISAAGVRYHIYVEDPPLLTPRRLGGKTFYFTQADLDAFIPQRGSAGHRRKSSSTPSQRKPGKK